LSAKPRNIDEITDLHFNGAIFELVRYTSQTEIDWSRNARYPQMMISLQNV